MYTKFNIRSVSIIVTVLALMSSFPLNAMDNEPLAVAQSMFPNNSLLSTRLSSDLQKSILRYKCCDDAFTQNLMEVFQSIVSQKNYSPTSKAVYKICGRLSHHDCFDWEINNEDLFKVFKEEPKSIMSCGENVTYSGYSEDTFIQKTFVTSPKGTTFSMWGAYFYY